MATFTGRFLQLSKLTTEWNAADPVLMNGELGVADAGSSAPILKVGDGVRPWSALPQISGSGGGAANDYVVGTTTTLTPGSFATVTIDNSVDPPTISFGIPRGDTGPANTLAIGTTTTGAPGSPASATITGTPPAQTLNLIIPQGDVGPPGADGADGSSGPTGAPGPANNLTIGTTTTGAPGTPAIATITGTPPSQELNLTIPRGADGAGLVMVDPSGTIGLTMVPGVAATTMRSDSSPPLSQAIAPVWTGEHVWTNVAGIKVSNAAPLLMLEETDAAADAKMWRQVAAGGSLFFDTRTDANGAGRQWLQVNRAAFAIAGLLFGNVTDNPPYNFLGTGVTSVSGQIVVGAPAGGATGTGTINATAFFDDGVQLVNATAGNPSALVGLTAINGAGVTFMRSDAAPALNQAIAPLWSGIHNFGDAGSIQSTARIGLRNRTNAIEWGHPNAAGYASTIGYGSTGGRPFIAFNAEHGTIANSFRTRGVIGRILQSDAAGGLLIGRAALASADDQSLTVDVTINAAGLLTIANSLQVNGDHIAIAATDTYFEMRDTDAATDEKVYWLRNSGGTFAIQTRADSLAAGVNALTLTRVGVNPTQMLVGADGTAALPGISFWNDNDTGIYRRAANDMAFAIGGVLGAVFSATQNAFTLAPLYAVDGTDAAPGFGFNNDTNTGIYRQGADNLRITAGGLNIAGFANATGTAVMQLFGVIQAVNSGTPTAPIYSFNGDPDTGMYTGAGDNTLRFTTGGVITFYMDSPNNRVISYYPLQVVADGTPAAPAFTWTSDPDTGIWRAGTNTLALGGGGTAGMYVDGTGVYLLDGSASFPALKFNVDTDTGIFRVGADAIGIASGGAKLVEMAFNYLTVMHASSRAEIRLAGNGATAGTNSLDIIAESTAGFLLQRNNLPLYLGTNGTVRLTIAAAGAATFTHDVSAPSFTTSSARAIKRESGKPAHVAGMLARLRPLLYRLLDGDDREQLGLIAEEVHEVCPQLSDGKTVAYDRLAILLLAAWQDEHAEAA